MKKYVQPNERQLKRIEELFKKPPPNSKIAAAKATGVDLNELLEIFKANSNRKA
jgi:hypothetical protein